MNYWEFRPTVLVERLDALLQKGVTEVVSFVPWQAVESDISHLFTRFLQATSERRIQVSLIVSPELGVGYPNSGIPRDVLANPECLALGSNGRPLTVISSPNAHSVPSLLSPEFQKRYQSYLQRLDHFLLDVLKRNGEDFHHQLKLILTGSYWKYYRSPGDSSASAFEAEVGDFSSSSHVLFRTRVEQRFSQQEFCEPTPSAANRWKLKSMDENNRRWFLQHSEDQFRARSAQFFGRKSISLSTEQIELFSPEFDPSFFYSKLLSHFSGSRADFLKLSNFLDEAASRQSQYAGMPNPSWIFWSGSGAFSGLTSQQKQFLILKALLNFGFSSGGVFINCDDWFSFSDSFRNRMESLNRLMTQNEYSPALQGYYLNSHLWSSGGALWREFKAQFDSNVRMIASERVLLGQAGLGNPVLLVDPSVIFTRDELVRVISWTRAGRVAAIPRSLLYTERARQDLHRILQGNSQVHRMDLHVGIPFELYAMGDGQLIVYDAHALEKSESLESSRQFVEVLARLADVRPSCFTEPDEIEVKKLNGRDGGQAIFVLNPHSQSVSSKLIFSEERLIQDLSLSGDSRADRPVSAKQLELDVPAFGILPLLSKSRELEPVLKSSFKEESSWS